MSDIALASTLCGRKVPGNIGGGGVQTIDFQWLSQGPSNQIAELLNTRCLVSNGGLQHGNVVEET